MPSTTDDLAFSFRVAKGGNVSILRHDRVVTTLRGAAARDFLAEIDSASLVRQRQLMARLTGNYKRGNERRAAQHPRNRGQGNA